MTTVISSELQVFMNRQTVKVSYRADVPMFTKKEGEKLKTDQRI